MLGCSTHTKRLMEPRNLFYSGQMDECQVRLDKLAKSHRGDRDVVMLDMALVDLLNGRPKEAETRLKEVRERFEFLEQDSVAEKTLSYWTDDQTRSYAGEDYEKILLYAFLAMSNLMYDGGDAESFSLQMNEKQQQLAQVAFDKYGEEAVDKYKPVPFGHYLRGMLRESTRRDYDDAIKQYSIVSELLPHATPFQWDLQRAQSGVHSSPGMGVLYVFAMVGRGPVKVQSSEQPTSDALLIADRIVSAVGPYSVPPTLAAIKVPNIELPPIDVDAVGVAVDGQLIGPTECVTSIERLALDTYAVNKKAIVARAVARRVIKKASIVTAKSSMGTEGLTSLAMDAVGVAWEATESADTRCWGLLPREIQVLRVELPAGSHSIALQPLLMRSKIAAPSIMNVDVIDGCNSYVLCCCPDGRMVGKAAKSGH